MLPFTKKGRVESPLLVTGGAAIPPNAEVEEETEDEVTDAVLFEKGADDDTRVGTLDAMLELVAVATAASAKTVVNCVACGAHSEADETTVT